MKKLVLAALLLALSVASAQSAKPAKKMAAMPDHTILQPNDLQWGDAPAVLPAGAKMAVLAGDPGKPGIFIVRLKAPDGYKIMPHWHPTTEYVTVVSGTFNVGMGKTWDDKGMTQLGAGAYASLNAKAPHYGSMKGETVIQIGGMGPFKLIYVDPKDDPSKKMAAAQPAAKPAKKK